MRKTYNETVIRNVAESGLKTADTKSRRYPRKLRTGNAIRRQNTIENTCHSIKTAVGQKKKK